MNTTFSSDFENSTRLPDPHNYNNWQRSNQTDCDFDTFGFEMPVEDLSMSAIYILDE